VPLHEWNTGQTWKDGGWQHYELDLRTWVFEEESFVPMALLLNGKAYSIVTDRLGTPTEAYNAEGEEVWRRRLDMNGKILEEVYDRNVPYSDRIRIPFLFQGQYYDHETELAYNRFRYYAPELRRYISEDPIRFDSGTTALHSYVEDTTGWIDIFGLAKSHYNGKRGEARAKHDLE
jgi:rhs family protein